MDLADLDNRWLALQVRPRWEQKCAAILHGKGYEEFLPLSTPKLMTLSCCSPLFPGYLFCKFNIRIREPMLTTPGVIRVVGFGKTAIPISNEEIEAIRCITSSGLPTSSWPRLVLGERVRMIAGPLRGVQGILLSVKNSRRLVVSVDILNRAAAVEVDSAWVLPIHGTHPQSANA